MQNNTNQNNDSYKAAPIPDRIKKNKKIAIVTGNHAEDLEFFYPYYRFNEAGYDVDVITENGGEFSGKKGLGLKDSKSIKDVKCDDYCLLYLPGGKAPQDLRKNDDVLDFVKEFSDCDKPIATICHGAQILISAKLVKGKRISAWPEMKGELEEAGAEFADEALQIEANIISARKPGDLHRHLCGVLNCLNEQK